MAHHALLLVSQTTQDWKQDQPDQKWLKSEDESMAAKIKKGQNHKIHHKAHFKCLIKRLYISVPQPRSPRKLKKQKNKKKNQCPTKNSD